MTRRPQIWVVFAKYLDGTDRTEARAMLDMFVRPASASTKDLVATKTEIETEYAAIHTSYFALMSMHSPIVEAVMWPRMTSSAGRRQFIDHVRESCVGDYMDVDFERLFNQVDRGLHDLAQTTLPTDK